MFKNAEKRKQRTSLSTRCADLFVDAILQTALEAEEAVCSEIQWHVVHGLSVPRFSSSRLLTGCRHTCCFTHPKKVHWGKVGTACRPVDVAVTSDLSLYKVPLHPRAPMCAGAPSCINHKLPEANSSRSWITGKN